MLWRKGAKHRNKNTKSLEGINPPEGRSLEFVVVDGKNTPWKVNTKYNSLEGSCVWERWKAKISPYGNEVEE